MGLSPSVSLGWNFPSVCSSFCQDPAGWAGGGASGPEELLPLVSLQAGHVEPAPAEDSVASAPGAAGQHCHLLTHVCTLQGTQPRAPGPPLPAEPSPGTWHSPGRGQQGGSFSGQPRHPARGIPGAGGVWGGVTREGLGFPAVQSGGGYTGRGAVFPVESCTKQTQIPAKPRMVYSEQRSFSVKT